MDVSIKIPLPRLMLLALLSACGSREVLVITDPHIDAAGVWVPSSPGFARRAALAGFHVSVAAGSGESSPAELLADIEPLPDILILSPWNRYDPPSSLPEDIRIIIAGALPPPGAAENVTGLAADFSDAGRQAGRTAGARAAKEGRSGLLLADGDFPYIREGYRETAGEALPLIEIMLQDYLPGDPLPEDFISKAEESSMLLLFAGDADLAAYDVGADGGIPVITEFALGEGPWEERIIAGIEDDQRAMAKTLIMIMKGDIHGPEVYYPARLEKSSEKWFDAAVPWKL